MVVSKPTWEVLKKALPEHACNPVNAGRPGSEILQRPRPALPSSTLLPDAYKVCNGGTVLQEEKCTINRNPGTQLHIQQKST